MSSIGSCRFIFRPISRKLRMRASMSPSYDECINRAKASLMGGSNLLVNPKSSSTGTDASPGTAVDTSMLPPWGSALNRPPTCICTAHDSQTRFRSSSRSTPFRSIASVSLTAKPSQKSITRTRSEIRDGTVSGMIARTPLDRRRSRTSRMLPASVRKSSSFSTSRLYSRMTGPKSRSGSVFARSSSTTRRFSMSCRMSEATPRCCTFRTTSRGSSPSSSGFPGAPALSVARCTCARLAVESGRGSIDPIEARASSSNSSRTVASTSPKSFGGMESWSSAKAARYSGGMMSALVDRYWPTLTQKPARSLI
mmetsp:Transcript_20264/g.47642  ORF Transcript_20264/g.47642 Transcript_20264/m.47642 type:complete len:310 (+) Transcript_20264:505-1434(+)